MHVPKESKRINLLILFVYINPTTYSHNIAHGMFQRIAVFLQHNHLQLVNLQKVLHFLHLKAQEIQEIMVEDLEKTLAGIASDIKPWELEAPELEAVGIHRPGLINPYVGCVRTHRKTIDSEDM